VKQVLRAGFLALAFCFAAGVMTLPAAAQSAHATVSQSQGKSQAETAKTSAPPMQMDSPETEQQHDAYLYSSSVQWIAKKLGLPVKTTAQIFEWLNSGILLIVIFYFLFKMLPGIFRRRTERLQKDLVEAKQVSDDAKLRLAAIEERLSHLDAEIEAFRKRSEHESAEEERRLHVALETERKRIVHSAEQEINAAGATAQRSLQRYAAELAVGHVRENLKVDVNRDKALVAEFAKSIEGQQKGGRS